MVHRHLTSDFDYELPRELIAQEPAPRRDQARLLIVRRETAALEHRRFPALLDELRPGDVAVLNDTKVIPARLLGRRRRTGGKTETLLVRALDAGQQRWRALVKTRGRLEPGEAIELPAGAALLARRRLEGMEWEVEFVDIESVPELLARIGLPPLPPYIAQDPDDPARRERDLERYQTVYAARSGAIAAPTAGLHFTPELLDALRGRGVIVAAVTLHVGLGTFLPVKTKYLEDHPMHSEEYEVSAETARTIRQARAEGRRIIAVGTTSCRVLEAVDWDETDGAVRGETDLFIYPPYRFRCVGALLTNFHLPKSTLLALVCAFAGRDLILKAYREAVERRYRFYSYGDAMFIA